MVSQEGIARTAVYVRRRQETRAARGLIQGRRDIREIMIAQVQADEGLAIEPGEVRQQRHDKQQESNGSRPRHITRRRYGRVRPTPESPCFPRNEYQKDQGDSPLTVNDPGRARRGVDANGVQRESYRDGRASGQQEDRKGDTRHP